MWRDFVQKECAVEFSVVFVLLVHRYTLWTLAMNAEMASDLNGLPPLARNEVPLTQPDAQFATKPPDLEMFQVSHVLSGYERLTFFGIFRDGLVSHTIKQDAPSAQAGDHDEDVQDQRFGTFLSTTIRGMGSYGGKAPVNMDIAISRCRSRGRNITLHASHKYEAETIFSPDVVLRPLALRTEIVYPSGVVRTINLSLLAKALETMTDAGEFLKAAGHSAFPGIGVSGVFEALFLDACVGEPHFDPRKVCGQRVGAPRSIGNALRNMERVRRGGGLSSSSLSESQEEKQSLERVPLYQFFLVLDMLRTCGGADGPNRRMVWVPEGLPRDPDTKPGFPSEGVRKRALENLARGTIVPQAFQDESSSHNQTGAARARFGTPRVWKSIKPALRGLRTPSLRVFCCCPNEHSATSPQQQNKVRPEAAAAAAERRVVRPAAEGEGPTTISPNQEQTNRAVLLQKSMMETAAHPFHPPSHWHFPWLVVALFDPALEKGLLDAGVADQETRMLQEELVEIKKHVYLGEFGGVGPNGLVHLQAEEVDFYEEQMKKDVHELTGFAQPQPRRSIMSKPSTAAVEKAVALAAQTLVLPEKVMCVGEHLQKQLLELKLRHSLHDNAPRKSFVAPRVLPVGRPYEYVAPSVGRMQDETDFDLKLVPFAKPTKRDWPVLGATKHDAYKVGDEFYGIGVAPGMVSREMLCEMEWPKYVSWPGPPDLGFPRLGTGTTPDVATTSRATWVAEQLEEMHKNRLSTLNSLTPENRLDLLLNRGGDPILRNAHYSFLGSSGGYGNCLAKGEILYDGFGRKFLYDFVHPDIVEFGIVDPH